MPRQFQTPDPMFRSSPDGQEVLFGTAMYRLQSTIVDQPMDQEATGFYAGDVRDVCALCDASNKTVKALKDKTKGVAPGAEVSLSIADVQSVIQLAMNPPKPEQKDPA